MTNPSDIVRIRSRTGGRGSVYEANMWAQKFPSGLFSGNGVLQNTVPDMNVLVGGSSTNPDVVIGTNPSGYRIALDIVGQQAVAITAPASNSRITSIVAYTNNLAIASTQTAVTGSPATCGLIVVNGATGASPVAPDDAAIRSAITTDGATGSQAAYCVIANITVTSTTTAITNTIINLRRSQLQAGSIADGSIGPSKFIDSGWLTPTLTVGRTANTTQPPRYRKIGNIVYLRGVIEKASAFSINDRLFTLESSYLPTTDYVDVSTGAAAATLKIVVSALNGDVYVGISPSSSTTYVRLDGMFWFVD